MVEVHYCDNCGEEMINRMEVKYVMRDRDYGIDLSRVTAEVCSVKCVENWISRIRRSVSTGSVSDDFVSDGSVPDGITYHNSEIGNVGCWEVYWETYWGLHKENGMLCVKPEVWKQKMGIC